jgi:glycogen operon protein
VSYSFKHNEDNGEGNRDGDNNNFSANYGVEGPTRKRSIELVRQRQLKNFLATLLLSQGVPMLSAGDECRRTQRGNNNAYCQDNAISWFNWKQLDKNEELLRFLRALVAFRKANPTVRRRDFLSGIPDRPGLLPDVSWFAANGKAVDWYAGDASLTCIFGAPDVDEDPQRQGRHVMLFLHGGTLPRDFTVPEIARSIVWRKFIDTAAPTPEDIYPGADGPILLPSQPVRLLDRSLVCYVAMKPVSASGADFGELSRVASAPR